MTKDQTKELVGNIFGKEAAGDDDIVDWYFRVNNTAMEEYAKQMALAFFEFERGVPPEQMESNYDYFISKYQSKQ